MSALTALVIDRRNHQTPPKLTKLAAFLNLLIPKVWSAVGLRLMWFPRTVQAVPVRHGTQDRAPLFGGQSPAVDRRVPTGSKVACC